MKKSHVVSLCRSVFTVMCNRFDLTSCFETAKIVPRGGRQLKPVTYASHFGGKQQDAVTRLVYERKHEKPVGGDGRLKLLRESSTASEHAH